MYDVFVCVYFILLQSCDKLQCKDRRFAQKKISKLEALICAQNAHFKSAKNMLVLRNYVLCIITTHLIEETELDMLSFVFRSMSKLLCSDLRSITTITQFGRMKVGYFFLISFLKIVVYG